MSSYYVHYIDTTVVVIVTCNYMFKAPAQLACHRPCSHTPSRMSIHISIDMSMSGHTGT